MLFICGGILVANIRDARDIISASEWETTSGVLTILPGQSNIKIFAVEYLYSVEGAQYDGDRVYFFDRFQFAGPDDAYGLGREWVASKDIGDPVTVYYNPEHPERSVLNIGWYPKGLTIFFATLFGLTIVIFGPITLILGYFIFLRRYLQKLFGSD